MTRQQARAKAKKFIATLKMVPSRAHFSGWHPTFMHQNEWIECINFEHLGGPGTYMDCWHETKREVEGCWEKFKKAAIIFWTKRYLEGHDED